LKEGPSVTLYQSEVDNKLEKVWEAETTLSEQQSGQRNKSKEPTEVQNLDRDLQWKNFAGASSELQLCNKRHLKGG